MLKNFKKGFGEAFGAGIGCLAAFALAGLVVKYFDDKTVNDSETEKNAESTDETSK